MFHIWKRVLGCRSKSTKASFIGNENRLGLFGLAEPLHDSKDLLKLARKARNRINFVRKYLHKQNGLLSYSAKLSYLDNISNELCSIMDVAECCRSLHMDPEYVSQSELVFSELSGLIIDLNSDKELYNILETIVQNRGEEELSNEEKYFANDLLRDFQMEGIHFDNNEKVKLQQLQHEIVQAETSYNQNIVMDRDCVIQIKLTGNDKGDYQHLRNWLNAYIRQPSVNESKPVLHCKPDRRFLGPLINSATSEELRKSLWFENFVQPVSNVSFFGDLVSSRHKLANFLGYQSFLSKSIVKNVANEPKFVEELLQSLSIATKSTAQKELDELNNFKSQQSASVFSSLWSSIQAKKSETTSSNLNPWDLGYLQSNYHAYNHSFSEYNREKNVQEEAYQRIKSYLTLDTCLNGLKLVTKLLFALEMEEVENLDSLESWVTAEERSSIKKFHVYENIENSKQLIGVVYIDCLQRPNKFPGAAHFTVRCGCEKIVWNSEDLTNPLLFNSTQSLLLSTQIPIVVLSFSFPRSLQNTTTTQEDSRGFLHSQPVGDNICLSLQDLETLYHEWGHALHSILSRTKFQHLSGTRGGTDFIEIPSHLMEFFAREPSIIVQWAKHKITGESVPKQLLMNALTKRQDFAAIELQHQILLSSADQYTFNGENITGVHSDQDIIIRTLSGIAKLQSDLTVIPLASTRSLTENISDYPESGSSELKKVLTQNLQYLPAVNIFGHSHFINYGGSYYSYLLAKIYAAQIWFRLFADDPLNKDAGKFVREQMLSYGCSKSPREVLSVVAGNSLDPEYFLKSTLKSRYSQ